MSETDTLIPGSAKLREYFEQKLKRDWSGAPPGKDPSRKPPAVVVTPDDALHGLMILRLYRAMHDAGLESLDVPAGFILSIAGATEPDRDRLFVLLPDMNLWPENAEPTIVAERSVGGRQGFHKIVDRRLLEGAAVIALSARRDSLASEQSSLVLSALTLPAVNGRMIAEVLRQMHAASHVEVSLKDREIAKLSATQLIPVFAAPDVKQAIEQLQLVLQTVRPELNGSLDDVYGQPEAVSAMRQVIVDIEEWQAGRLDWQEVTKSFLLLGPPGTGKTMIATAFAGSAGIGFVKTSYSDCQKHGHQGDMLKALNMAAEEAILKAPAVFFVDEIDSFYNRDNSANGYIIGVVNGLLTLIDELSATPGVILIAASNDRDRIDPAVVRPGRFDKHIFVRPLDRDGVRHFLQKELGGVLDDNATSELVDQLAGATGAQLTALTRDAKTRSRAARRPLEFSDIQAAADVMLPSLGRDHIWRIAVHEAGHLLAGHLLDLPVARQVRVTARGGHVLIPEGAVETKETVEARMKVQFAGFAAECLLLEHPSFGAGGSMASDIAQATKLAIRSEVSHGLGKDISWRDGGTPLDLLPEPIQGRVEAVLQNAKSTALEILRAHKPVLLQLARVLEQRRELDGADIIDILDEAMGHKHDN